MKKSIVKIGLYLAFLLSLALASLTSNNAHAQTLTNILNTIGSIFTNLVIPILFLLATIVFLWGLIVYLTAAGDPEKVKDGKALVMWGVIALTVMSAAWGFTTILKSTFNIEKGTIPSGFPGGAPRSPDFGGDLF